MTQTISTSPNRVNTALRAHEDDVKDNQYYRYYWDQIDKVASKIKEVLVAMGSQGVMRSTPFPSTLQPSVVTLLERVKSNMDY